MQALLLNLSDTYLGPQYSKLISHLYSQPHTLESLVEVVDENYKHLIQKINYLIKVNVIGIQKKKGRVFYSVNQKMIMFFQRSIKYHTWMEDNCTKQEVKIMSHFFEVFTSSFEGYLRKEEVKPEQVERAKQVFAALVKKGYLYQDERALDLQLCNKREIEVKATNTVQLVESQKKDQEVKDTTKTKRKKKEIKLQITQGPLELPRQPQGQTNSTSIDMFRPHTFFSFSLNFILSRYQEQLMAKFLKTKFIIDKPAKSIAQMFLEPKFKFPYDFYNQPPLEPKQNLLKQIQAQLIEEYINLRYGKNSLLVYKTLLDKEYITEKNLLKLTLLDLKPLRGSINSLFVSGIVKSVQLKLQKTNCMIFWIDSMVVLREYINHLAKTIINLQILIIRFKNEINKNSAKNIQCAELELRVLKLEAHILQMDDNLILYDR